MLDAEDLWVELKKLPPIIRCVVDISAAVTKPADELRAGLALTFLQSIPNGPNGKSLGSGLRDQSYLPGQNHAHLALVDEPFRDDCCDPGSTTSVTWPANNHASYRHRSIYLATSSAPLPRVFADTAHMQEAFLARCLANRTLLPLPHR